MALMTDNILVGTASWTDKTLLACGRFYPPEANTPEARLRFYAQPVPDGGGRLQLLRHAGPAGRAGLGRAHAGRLRLQRQGVPALHRPPDATARAAPGHPAGARAGPAQAPVLPRPAAGDPGRTVAALQRGAGTAAPERQAGRGALPVRALAGAQPRRHGARGALRRTDAGSPAVGRVPQQDLARPGARREDDRPGTPSGRGAHGGRRAPRLRELRAAASGR